MKQARPKDTHPGGGARGQGAGEAPPASETPGSPSVAHAAQLGSRPGRTEPRTEGRALAPSSTCIGPAPDGGNEGEAKGEGTRAASQSAREATLGCARSVERADGS